MIRETDRVILSADKIDPDGLTFILRSDGLHDVVVQSVRPILSKRLPYSTIHRIEIEYAQIEASRTPPRTLVLKLCGPSTSEHSPADIGRMEVEFYQTLAPEMSCPPLIHCYDAAYSNDTGHSHIILDDHFATHSQPEDNQPPSIENSRLAVAALAAAHAAWWEDARLGTEIGEFFDKDKLNGFVRELSSSVEAFIEHAGDSLTNEQKRAYEKMLASASVIWGRLQSPARLTVTHGDVHWWNFLYPNDPSVDDVYLFDWHLWHLDLGARDLAFLLALGGFAEPRPEIESALLQIYLDTLMKYGVVNYCWDDLQLDYRWSAIRNLNIPVIFRSQGKNESTWRTALRRSWESYQRLGCAELLE